MGLPHVSLVEENVGAAGLRRAFAPVKISMTGISYNVRDELTDWL
jgi:hypothetical protein